MQRCTSTMRNQRDYTQLTADEVFSNEHKDKLAGKIVVVGLDAAGLSVLKYTPHGLTTDQMITAQGTRHHNDWQVPVQTRTGRRIRNSVHGIFIVAVDTCSAEDQCVVGSASFVLHRDRSAVWCIRWHTQTKDS